MSQFKEFRTQDFQIEFLLILLFGIFIIFHYNGKSQNRKIAQEFLGKLQNLKKEFVLVGDGFGHELIYNCPNEYILYASGRQNLEKMFATIKTSPRHDITKIGKQTSDKVTFSFTLTGTNSHIFALFPKRNASNKLKRWDLEKMTSLLSFPEFRKDVYSIVGDNYQVFSSLLSNKEFKACLYEFSGLSKTGEGNPNNYFLEEMVCSDSCSIKPSNVEDLRREMILSFTFRTSQDQEEVDQMISFMFTVLDTIANINLLKETINKIAKIRILAEQSLIRASQEEIQQNLYKKKLVEKKMREEARTKMSPEEARKAEEKEKRRELKKSTAKMRKKGKMVVR